MTGSWGTGGRTSAPPPRSRAGALARGGSERSARRTSVPRSDSEPRARRARLRARALPLLPARRLAPRLPQAKRLAGAFGDSTERLHLAIRIFEIAVLEKILRVPEPPLERLGHVADLFGDLHHFRGDPQALRKVVRPADRPMRSGEHQRERRWVAHVPRHGAGL